MNRRVNVSIDTKTLLLQGVAACDTRRRRYEAPRYIPAWVLPHEDLDNLMAAGRLKIDSFNRKVCSLILFEIGFCRDLGCHK